jgi:hypothetical protein
MPACELKPAVNRVESREWALKEEVCAFKMQVF